MNSNLWFISIDTRDDATDFSNWLDGKRKIFNDTMEFKEWFDAYNAFPLEILLDGVHYVFKERDDARMFIIGFNAAIHLNKGY